MNIDQIVDWWFADRVRTMSDDQATEAFNLFNPRCRFVKTMPLGASILDVGAGDGTLHIYRQWPYLPRLDLKVFAYAGQEGANFAEQDGFEVGWWPQQPPNFDSRQFEGIMASSFIEHIDHPLEFVRWACDRLTVDGRLYLEWPHPESASLPTNTELRARGVDVMTGNYFDDPGHRAEIPCAEKVLEQLIACGMRIDAFGVVSLPFLEDELASAARSRNDTVISTMAYWSYTGWCQFIVARS